MAWHVCRFTFVEDCFEVLKFALYVSWVAPTFWGRTPKKKAALGFFAFAL